MDTDLSPTAGALAYEQAIRAYFSHGPVRFDFVLLGLGDNSHTASLFPHTSVLHEQSALVKEIYVDEVNMYRITLTAPVINQAAHVVFLVYGVGKAEAVRHIIEDGRDIELYPAQLIEPKTVPCTGSWMAPPPASLRSARDIRIFKIAGFAFSANTVEKASLVSYFDMSDLLSSKPRYRLLASLQADFLLLRSRWLLCSI